MSTPPESVPSPRDFDAFLSYAHADRATVAGLQKGLHHIGRRVGQLRALRVFRDDTDLTASADLSGRITDALDRSRFLIATLSPAAAASRWVDTEISYWLEHRGREQMMLVLAAGVLRWDEATARFDPEGSDAAPPALTVPGALPVEPLYIDVSSDAPWDYRAPGMRDKVTSLAAPIHGKPKDQLASDDLREQRRFRRLRSAAITALAVLTIVAVIAAIVAVAQRQQAVRHLRDAVVAKLNAEGAAMLANTVPGTDVRALQELLVAHALSPAPDDQPILDAQISRFGTEKIALTLSPVHQLTYSPDGRRVLTAQDDGTVRQWDATTALPVGPVIRAATGAVTGVAMTADGATVGTTGADGSVRFWRADTGAPAAPSTTAMAAQTGIAALPFGTEMVTGGGADTLRVWDSRSGRVISSTRVFTDTGTPLTDVAFDHDGGMLAVSASRNGLVLYDIGSGHAQSKVITLSVPGHDAPIVTRLAFSPVAHAVAVVGDDLEVFDTDDATLVKRIAVSPLRAVGVQSVAYSPDGTRIVTGRSDGAVQLWDATTLAQLGPPLTGHTAGVTGVQFSPDGSQIASVSQDGTLRLWNVGADEPLHGADGVIGHVAFSPDGREIGAIGDRVLQLWDTNTRQPRPPMPVAGKGGKSFAFVAGGRLITAAPDGTVQVLDADTGSAVSAPVHIGVKDPLPHFAFRSDGRAVASGDDVDGTIDLWDPVTGRPLRPPMTVDPPRLLNALAFSRDDHHLVAGYGDGVRLWNVDTGAVEGAVMAGPARLPISSVDTSRDGALIAAGREDGAIELWNAATHQAMPHSPLAANTSQVFSLAFGAGHRLASGGADARVRLIDTGTGRPEAAPITMSDVVTGVAMSPDGRLVAMSALDGTLMVEPAVADPGQLCTKITTNMSRSQWRQWVSPDIEYQAACPGLPIAPDDGS